MFINWYKRLYDFIFFVIWQCLERSQEVNSLISLCLALFREISKGKFVDFVVPGSV